MFETLGRRARRGRLARLPAAGDGAGHLHQLQERAPARAAAAAVRDRAGRQVVPQRDHARATSSSGCASSSRWRWSSSSRRTTPSSGTPTGSTRGLQLVPRARAARVASSACASTAPEERSHYSLATSDIEYLYPIGWSELEGVANRGDYDLRQHTEAVGHEARVRRPGRRALHAARDRAGGLDRPDHAGAARGRLRRGGRRGARAHAAAAAPGGRAGEGGDPAADLEGARRDGRAGAQALRGAPAPALRRVRRRREIGRRYRRQDEIGTPWAFTIDEQTLEDGTVTVRDRDSLAQERLPLDGVRAWLDDALERPWTPPQERLQEEAGDAPSCWRPFRGRAYRERALAGPARLLGGERSQAEAAVVLVRRRDHGERVARGALAQARVVCLGERSRQEPLDPGEALGRERQRAVRARAADGAAGLRRVADERRSSAPHSAQLVRCGR